jgi:phage-related protein (TIGR01555 family)
MILKKLFSRFFAQDVKPEAKEVPKVMRIRGETLAQSLANEDVERPKVQIEAYRPPTGVVPESELQDALAMDSTQYDYVNAVYGEARFKGYPYLAMLAQRPEYRKISEVRAKEMTRKWIRLTSKGDDDKTERLQQLEAALIRYKVRSLFRRAAELDGFFGRGQIYIDVKKPDGGVAQDDPDELQTPLLLDKAKIKKGSLIGFKVVEPVWTYPSFYNSTNPLAKDYYKPLSWYVMGKTVHASRLLMFVSREVPDMLKAAYNFGGLSLSQMAEPYIENWLRTQKSVSDLVHSFSVSGIKTNMSAVLNGGGGEQMFNRAKLFNMTRDTRGMFMIDKDTEEFFQFNTPLSGLDALQAQAQEQMASVSSIPLVKLLGITPSGLNASADGEIRVFYDDIHSQQEATFSDPLKRVLDVIQLSEFGEIDLDIGFEFEQLWQASEVEQATIRKTDADTDVALIGAGVISPDDARSRLASDPMNDYHGLEVNDVKDLDAEEDGDGLDND